MRVLLRRRCCTCILVLTWLTVLYLAYSRVVSSVTLMPSSSRCSEEQRFVDAAVKYADTDGWIVIAVVDTSFIDMALNLYETSFQPHRIQNFIFVGFGAEVCRTMCALSLPCYCYPGDTNDTRPSSFYTAEFRRKSHRRNNVILEALEADLTVLYTDVDVVFMRNPLPLLKPATKTCDIATQMDKTLHCSGFVVVKPTPGARRLYQDMNRVASRSPIKTSEQKIMNQIIRTTNLSIVKLLPPKFCSGFDYFSPAERSFFRMSDRGCHGDSCPVVVHNNYIVTKAAKIYRFREHLMWMYDDKGTYYGSKTNKYLTYKNSANYCINAIKSGVSSANVTQHEMNILRGALFLAELLGRIVILPRFHCGSSCMECPLNTLLNVEAFDSVFDGRYRENSFLLHPKVPKPVKEDVANVDENDVSDVHNIARKLVGNREAVIVISSTSVLDHQNANNQTLAFADRTKIAFGSY